MELLESFWVILGAAWDMALSIIDPFVNLETFVPALIVLLVAGFVLTLIENFFWDVVLLIFVGSSVFGLLLSINDVPQALALFAGVVVFTGGLVQSMGDANSRKVKFLDIFLIAGMVAVAFGIGADVVPGLDYGDQYNDTLARAGEFMGRSADAARKGAEIITK